MRLLGLLFFLTTLPFEAGAWNLFSKSDTPANSRSCREIKEKFAGNVYRLADSAALHKHTVVSVSLEEDGKLRLDFFKNWLFRNRSGSSSSSNLLTAVKMQKMIDDIEKINSGKLKVGDKKPGYEETIYLDLVKNGDKCDLHHISPNGKKSTYATSIRRILRDGNGYDKKKEIGLSAFTMRRRSGKGLDGRGKELRFQFIHKTKKDNFSFLIQSKLHKTQNMTKVTLISFRDNLK